MVFGNKGNDIELLRFCNKINTIVHGAANKLFNHFISNYEFNTIISFADRSIFNGQLYTTLNFKKSGKRLECYWWVVDEIRRHKSNYRKQKLINAGADPSLTESQIMHMSGNYKVYGSGLDKYVYTK